MEIVCPECGSKAVKKNGYTRHGKQNHRCLGCGRQFSRDLPPTDFGGLLAEGIAGDVFVQVKS